ncbi:hypothetical protein SPONL_1551 [uncultured Candidatus Thioglobus sp.]|nr:hypothetical protein SPONL_1551 [uncultured Candidatus Thioglobus sp.]
MKEHIIEVEIDENGDIFAETKNMQGKVCVKELDAVLEGIKGEKETKNTGDFYKTQQVKQTITRGK